MTNAGAGPRKPTASMPATKAAETVSWAAYRAREELGNERAQRQNPC